MDRCTFKTAKGSRLVLDGIPFEPWRVELTRVHEIPEDAHLMWHEEFEASNGVKIVFAREPVEFQFPVLTISYDRPEFPFVIESADSNQVYKAVGEWNERLKEVRHMQ